MSYVPSHLLREKVTYESREMIDRDDGTSLSDALGVDFYGGLGERGVDVVDRNRVVRVCGAIG
jgi:hypothetical protein